MADSDSDLGPRVPPRSLAVTEFATANRRRDARIVGLLLLATAVAAVVVAVVGRDSIEEMWPSTVRVYRAFSLVDSPITGLEVALTQRRTVDELIVDGDIVNRAAAPRRVPRLRLALHDASRTEVDAKVIDPPVESLAPGATAHFTTVFEHPSMTATGVVASFAAEQ